MKPLLCLDMDNTLVYSEEANVKGYNDALKKVLNIIQKPSLIIKLMGRPHEEIVKMLIKKANKTATKEQIKEIMYLHDKFIINKYYKLTKAIPGIKKTLKELKKKYNIAAISNASYKNVIANLKGAKIPKNLFKAIVGYDQVKHSKPAPDLILKVDKILKTKASYMIGDSIYDIKAAKRAKVKAIAVLTGHYSKTSLKKEKPLIILKSVNKLPKFLEKEEKCHTI